MVFNNCSLVFQAPRKCYESVKMSREQRPEERCTLRPKRVCRGGDCRSP